MTPRWLRDSVLASSDISLFAAAHCPSAHQIKALRRQHQLTQDALAHRLGVSFATVNRWERGRSRPRALVVLALRALAQARSVPSRAEVA